MNWTWDPDKNRSNEEKHHIDFTAARAVFNDPFALTYPDPYPYEVRWRTIGMVHSAILIVVHTWPDEHPEFSRRTGRIISARIARRREIRDYEEGYI